MQGSADLNLYKMFAEFFWNLLQRDGRLGVILPTGIYSDFGTKDLRVEFLQRGRLEFLYAFQNEKRVFATAHHAGKQVTLVVTKGGSTTCFHTRFRMGVGDSPEAHEIPGDLLLLDAMAMPITPEDIVANSPKALCLVELKSQRDLDIFRKTYANSSRIGDNDPAWGIVYAREFDMTNDSKHFPPLEHWKSEEYRRDVYGCWKGPHGDIALPFYQGALIHQFDPCYQAFVAGSSKAVHYEVIPHNEKQVQPQFLMSSETAMERVRCRTKVVFRAIANPTNQRSMIASVLSEFPCGHMLPVIYVNDGDLNASVCLSALLNSFLFDRLLRLKMGSPAIGFFILDDMPLPNRPISSPQFRRAGLLASCLSFIHRRFAPEWLQLKSLCPELAGREWKHWWAVTETDRLRLRVEIDALCADLYGLDPDDFDWIVRDDKTDPKGFYRVDRELPFRERLTGLAAAAFRALKDGKWSAESAAMLTNDEFFDILGIPELTSADAARAKGLPGPLILARDGCHVWKPENFPPDDPRHGWTWDDCWNDAVALLGSEEAVEKYIAEKPASEPDTSGDKERTVSIEGRETKGETKEDILSDEKGNGVCQTVLCAFRLTGARRSQFTTSISDWRKTFARLARPRRT